MARASVYILLFAISMQAGAQMLIATGVAADLGLDPTVGEPEEIESAQSQAEEFEASQGIGGTLFGLWTGLAGTIGNLYDAVLPAQAMFERAGIDGFYMTFAFAIVPLVASLDIIVFLRSGGELY